MCGILTQRPDPVSKNRPEASAEEEVRELSKPCVATQWNAALFDDGCLLVVPESHNRARSPDERRVNLEADGRGAMPKYILYS